MQARMSTEGDDTTYVEVKNVPSDTFQMDKNESYTNIRNTRTATQSAGYPQLGQQTRNDNNMVTSQPGFTPMVTTVLRPSSYTSYGTAALVLSVLTFFTVFFMGCWWTLPCSIVGLLLGITSTTQGAAGDTDTSKTHAYISIGFATFSWVLSIIGVVIIVGATVGTITSYNNQYYDYYY